jgi:hypothetical protein
MVQPNFLSLIRLKSAWFSVLLSNPLTKDEFAFIWIRTLVYVVVSLRDGVRQNQRGDLQQTTFIPTRRAGGAGVLLLSQSRLPF